MPEFFLELFSEEIPARMQQKAVETLTFLCTHHLQFILPSQTHFRDRFNESISSFYGPRRIAVGLNVYASDNRSDAPFGPERLDSAAEIRGPRIGALDPAITGFLRKYEANRTQLIEENGFYILKREIKTRSAKELIIEELLPNLPKLGWPKSMRWGQSGDFTWVRPLRHIVCLLDGETIPLRLGPITASNETEGHRFMAPGAFQVASRQDWESKLYAHNVIADQNERRKFIVAGLKNKAAELQLHIVEDAALLDEVTGLVEWPVPLIGKIDERFMDLPPEVRELSMKVNQRYFALRDSAGKPASKFAFVSNIKTADDEKAIIAGNERVLRARLSDARHFWDLDLKTPLDELLPKLEKITFHAKIGNQLERSNRIAQRAKKIAMVIGADPIQAEWAGRLCKADLLTGMVGEFPELQGIMGGYYAEKNPRGWDGSVVGEAIKTHYQPKGPTDAVPASRVAIAVALADKLDTLTEFLRIGEKPTGSGDPYALRRAALGVIRIILENELTLPVNNIVSDDESLRDFINERLRVKLRGEGKSFDVLDAVLSISRNNDLLRTIKRVNAISDFLCGEDGSSLLIGYRRAANILKIEDAKDGPHKAEQSSHMLLTQEETALQAALRSAPTEVYDDFNAGKFGALIGWLANLRPLVDAFFEKVTVNTAERELRRARLGLLAQLRDRMHLIADFSKIEG